MNKPFKKLLGNRVYLNIPVIPESPLVLSEEVKKELIAKEQNKYMRLSVYAVGDALPIDYLQEGDFVFVDPTTLQNAPVIHLTDQLSVLMISPASIIHIW